MSLNNVPAGKNVPEEINVIIEIPANSDPIKYEVDKDTGASFVDRFMATPMFYDRALSGDLGRQHAGRVVSL